MSKIANISTNLCSSVYLDVLKLADERFHDMEKNTTASYLLQIKLFVKAQL